jgi:hypothetical protein
VKRFGYEAELKRRIARVFQSHNEIPDHRANFPWITGFLGDSFAGVWFVAENPSLGMARRGHTSAPGGLTSEAQWAISPGDILFREMLVKYGFKKGSADSPRGWRCYITDLIKSAVQAEEWNRKDRESRLRVAEAWAGVFSWELRTGRPRLIVVMGKKVQDLLTHLTLRAMVPLLPPTVHIDHYAYIGQRADARRGLRPMHPTRVAEYEEQFAAVARSCRDALRQKAVSPD